MSTSVDDKRGAQPAGNLCRVARRSGSVIEVPAYGPGPRAQREVELKRKRLLRVCTYVSGRMGLESTRADTSRINSIQFIKRLPRSSRAI